MRIKTALNRISLGLNLFYGADHGLVILVNNLVAVYIQADNITFLQKHKGIGLIEQGVNIRCQEILALTHTQNQWTTLSRANNDTRL